MAKKAAWIFGLGLGALALLLFSRRAEAAPAPGVYLPDIHDIETAENMVELDTYYELINELYVRGDMDQATYNVFYKAYEDRWYELMGVS